MIYVMSDIHGRIDLFHKMLEKIQLKKDDKLYVIGDCIDRGGGIDVLKKIIDLEKKGQAELILGNHEYIFASYIDMYIKNQELSKISYENINYRLNILNKKYQKKNLFDSIISLMSTISNTEKQSINLQKMKYSRIATIMMNEYSGFETLGEYISLPDEEQKEIYDFLKNAKYLKGINIDGQSYILVHGGLHDDNRMCLDIRDEFFMNPVSENVLEKRGFSLNSKVIFGHTTTQILGIIHEHEYKICPTIWHDPINNDKIGIDCGCCYPNGQLACLRLDDMKEFYVKNEQDMITPIEKINKSFALLRHVHELLLKDEQNN